MNRKIIGFILLTLLQLGCTKDFLDRDPIIGLTVENFYRTEEDALAAVNAAYAALQFELTPAGHFRWFWGDIMSDDAVKGGSGDNDVFDLLLLETFQGPVNTALLESEWTANYEGIYRANVVLERVPGISMDAQLKDRVLAEARFIRAWFYYNLVTMFGGVPLVDKPLAPSEYNRPRASEQEIWAFIEADLQIAMEDLWPKSAYELSDIGRATQGAAQALYLKACIFQKKWPQAQAVAEAIVASNEYQLMDSYGAIFTRGGENGSESVFEIQYMTESGGNWGYNNANEGTFTNVFQRARGQFEGFGFNIPTEEFVSTFFEEGFEDPRLRFTVFREGEPMGDRGIFTLDATGYPHRYYARKYFSNKAEEASFGDPNPNGGSNDRVIRYADVLLMHAEAAWHNGQEAAARNSLNAVRARARGTNSNVLPDITVSGQPLLQAIYRERRLELGLEGHRFFDLVRTGRAAQQLGPLGYRDDVHRLFPIPDSQVRASNGILTQNPGY